MMPDAPPGGATPRPATRSGWLPHPVLLGIMALCLGVEAVLLGADWGLWGSARWRLLAYQNGGFWTGLLGNWRPNYPGQPVLMFATYGFLHGGPGHAVANMVTLGSLGMPICDRLGTGRFLALYAAALLGGAAGFVLLSFTVQPMVGASGALFGLAGALLAWEWRDRRRSGTRLAPVIWAVLGLGVLNAAMFWWLEGLLAWQTHLGGFLAGWPVALLLDQRRRAKTLS